MGYNPYKRNSQQEGQEANNPVPIEDEWFENMADKDWVMDIDDEIDELIKADSSESNKQVNVNAELTIKTTDEKEPMQASYKVEILSHYRGNVFTM